MLLPATGGESLTGKERKWTPAAIWHGLLCPRNECAEWQGHTEPGQKEPVLSGEAVRDTASGAQGWERPLQMHTFYLPPHQVVTHLQREPFQ